MAVLTPEEVDGRLAALEGWSREGAVIVKRFTREGGFMGSVGFVNAVAEPAERMDHHPDLEISWTTDTVRLSTHTQGGITELDLTLAGEIDALA